MSKITQYYTINGEKKALIEWCAEYNIAYHIVFRRIKYLNWDAEKAITTPVVDKSRPHTKNDTDNPIAAARIKKGLSQKQLADALNLPQQNISRWEHGVYPKPKALNKIAEILDVDVIDLIK